MIILDTNVVSALMMEEPDVVAAVWLNTQARTSVWTTSITIFEIRFGLNTMAAGRRRVRREAEFENMLRNDLQGRILHFDHVAADEAAALMAARRSTGRSIDMRDTMIAGIAIAQRATLATRNVRHFHDLSIPVVDPWSG